MPSAEEKEQLCHYDELRGSRMDFPWGHIAASEKAKPWYHPVDKLWHKEKRELRHKKQTFTWVDWLAYCIPCFRWIRAYNLRTMLVGDICAGLSVGFMIVAQGLSYATLAGVPSVYGLYGAFLPCMAYALVGTSNQLAVGPVAVTSLLIGSSMKNIVPCVGDITNANSPKPEQVDCQNLYNHKVIQLAFIVACMYTAVGVLRLGWVTNFLSHAVISGFTSGASITIGLSQVKYILGYTISSTAVRLQDILAEYVNNARNFKWQEFIMGTTLLFMLIFMKEVGKRSKTFSFLRFMGPITACIVGLLAVVIGNVDQMGIRVIGSIPSGLPKPTVNQWAPIDDFGKLLPVAAVVMLVDLLESTSIARALARKNGYELNYNLEIIGLGLANFAGAAFNAYTTTGSFSRSAVNDQAGSKSPLAQFITAWVVGFVLLFLTPVFSHLPFNVLGAVIVASIVTLFDYEQAIYLFRVNKLDFLVWCASFLGTLFISVEIGLGIAIGLALLLAIYQTAFPHTAVLGRVPGSTVYRNVKQYPNAVVQPGILVFRIDAPLYFANVKTLQDKLTKVQERMQVLAETHGVPGLQYVILDLTPTHHMDAMGLHFMEDLVFECTRKGMQVILANPGKKVLAEMEAVSLADLLGREWIFVSVHDAMLYCTQRLAEKGYSIEGVNLSRRDLSDSDGGIHSRVGSVSEPSVTGANKAGPSASAVRVVTTNEGSLRAGEQARVSLSIR